MAIGGNSETTPRTYSGEAMACFTESNQGLDNNDGLHLSDSRDGLNWTLLNQTISRTPKTWAPEAVRGADRGQSGGITCLTASLAT